MLMRRRPLARAAMLAGTGYVAYQAGKGTQQRAYHEQAQDAQLAEMQQQQAQGPAAGPAPQYYEQAPPPPAAAPAPAETTAQRIEALSKLKELLDAGVLSQDEFEEQKKQLLGS